MACHGSLLYHFIPPLDLLKGACASSGREYTALVLVRVPKRCGPTACALSQCLDALILHAIGRRARRVGLLVRRVYGQESKLVLPASGHDALDLDSGEAYRLVCACVHVPVCVCDLSR